jgi:hypothetical protein
MLSSREFSLNTFLTHSSFKISEPMFHYPKVNNPFQEKESNGFLSPDSFREFNHL